MIYGFMIPNVFGDNQAVKNSKESLKETGKETAELKSETTTLKHVKSMVSGVTQVVGSGPKQLIENTIDETKSGPPVLGTVEGIKKGSGELVDSTVKGAYKVATLGYGEVKKVEMEEPKKPKDAEDSKDALDPSKKDPTKFKISIP